MKYINFEELKKAIPNGWGKRNFLKRFLQSAPVTAIKCDYYTEKKLNEFTNGATVNGFSIVYAYERSGATWYTFETYTKARAEELRKDKEYTKYICFQTVEAVEELQRIRNERQKSRRPFGEKYYKQHTYYYCNKPIKTDKNGFTSYYQMQELKAKAEQIKRQKAQQQYNELNTVKIIENLQNKINEVKQFTFTPSYFNLLLLKDCNEFIKLATEFIKTDKQKGFTSVSTFFTKLDNINNFYNCIIEDKTANKKYYFRYIWAFDSDNKKADRITQHEFIKYNALYNTDANMQKIYNTSANGNVKLLTIKK